MPPTNESAVKQAMAWWCNCHIKAINSPYLPTYGKDQTIMKQIIALYGINKTFQLINEFFKVVKEDEFLKKTGASVGVFKSQLPKLLIGINNCKDERQIGRL